MANPTPAKPGYETTFITKPEMTDDALKALQEKLNGVVSAHSGELVLTEDWGKRKLAYTIAKEQRGHYTYFVYSGTPGVVHEVERNLRLHDQVLRFLTVNLDVEFDADKFRKLRSDIRSAAKRREEEREARREERHYERREEREHRYDERESRFDDEAKVAADVTAVEE